VGLVVTVGLDAEARLELLLEQLLRAGWWTVTRFVGRTIEVAVAP
jgi:hypothetical protein